MTATALDFDGEIEFLNDLENRTGIFRERRTAASTADSKPAYEGSSPSALAKFEGNGRCCQ